ncbi:MAG: HAD family phosphatase [Candidatus Dadabacteria bacterium]|nr:HAD family phosphatase [Candidatus Dadabacteria bacterium]
MIKAVIFDFDGVIVDSEPLHLRAFQRTVETLGLKLSTTDYYLRYLACDDKSFFRRFLEDNGQQCTEREIARLVREKGICFEEMIGEDIRIFPGVIEFLEAIRGKFYVAIGSGALTEEINLILRRKGLSEFFGFVIGADDTENPKPSPEVYLKCLERLRIDYDSTITAAQCIVFEDSPHGVLAAKRAGMRCVGITNSCSGEELGLADRVADSFSEIIDDFPEVFKIF